MAREIDGQVVILDLKRSSYLRSNASGAGLWELLQEDRDRGDLVDHLIATYGIDMATAERDVDAFVGMLTAEGLLEEA